MSGLAKKLAGQTAVYGVSSIVGRVLTYLLVPLYTARFAASEYGIVTELYAYVAFLNVVFTFGMETAFFRFANRAGANRRKLYSQVLSLLLLSSAVLSGLVMLLSGPIAEILKYPGKERFFIWLALVMAIDAVVAIPFARLRLEGKAKKFAAIRLANVAANVGLTLFFVVFCADVWQGKYLTGLRPLIGYIYDPDLGVGYVFWVNLLANALFIPLLWRELTDFRFRLDWAQVPALWRYGYPIMLMGLAGMINETLDRPMLKYWLPEGFYPGQSNLTAVGVYGACYKLSIFMQLVIQAFRYAAEPFFFSQAQEKNSPATFAVVLKWFTLCCAVIFVAVSLNLDILEHLFLRRPEYRTGVAVVPVLLLANLFLGVYYNLSVWFKLTDRTYFGTYISAGGALLTVVLNWLLIPHLGYLGCAFTTLACYFLMAFTCWWLGNRYFPVPYPVGRLAAWLLLAVGVVAVGWYVPIADWWLRQGAHVLLTLGFVAVLFVVERRTLPAARVAAKP
ncbi:oligosaccharide flippase family protein [Hymenobacter busanensis]|uniref:Oligosaccharide flippase family protein n=1 Tax=Hymenobacter busanensis TaxID=2607656 RepID=A0A7L4ZWC0_9BACT|nr:polysaccharide biosynthesis C-terminal domain-containing protein [Hymenobacter busanensis]KAA9325540.1 oligosaccharide flippase family protein [Hymenobacter busanensis]QHJ07789.1 oligosaccharide flippase family protein [Hymenobacter busanensis]